MLVAINNLVSLALDNRSDKESLDRAIALADALKNSNVPQFQDTLGWAQYRKRDYKSSISTLENALAKLPDLAAVHYHLGMSYAAEGQSEKADEQLKAASTLEPDGTALKESIPSAMKTRLANSATRQHGKIARDHDKDTVLNSPDQCRKPWACW